MKDPSGTARDAITPVIGVCDTLAELTQISFDEFVADTRSQWPVEMGLIRIDEGVNRIPEPVLERFAEQPWRQIVGMRNFAAISMTTWIRGGSGEPSPSICRHCAPTWPTSS